MKLPRQVTSAMYSTISLANYRRAEAAAQTNDQQQPAILFPPPEGPYSAYLLLNQTQDDEENDEKSDSSSCCWGFCESKSVRRLPFPQDKCLSILYTQSNGKSSHTERDKVYCIPVLGHPMSSNRYYVVRAERIYKGLVETCSTDEGMVTCCWCRYVADVRPTRLQPDNPYQHMQISGRKLRGFTAKSVASDGFPPRFLRRKYWRVSARSLRGEHDTIGHVRGMNTHLRAQLPPFHSQTTPSGGVVVVVGEWYCPFIFIRESGTLLEDPKAQLMECPFYKMELHKLWEQIYSAHHESGGKNDVVVETTVKVEEALLFGEEATEEVRENDGSVWFKRIPNQERGQAVGVRLSMPIIAKIKADQGRDGAQGGNRDVRVQKSFTDNIGIGLGRTLSCYVVVEKYVLKRMDGSIALTLSFRNCGHIQEKWQ